MPRRHHHEDEPRILQEGELLVTGDGEVTLDEALRRSRALLIHSEEAIFVAFKKDETPCPPCAGGQPDELEWEVFERRRQLFLKIKWHVNSARTIVWCIYEVD